MPKMGSGEQEHEHNKPPVRQDTHPPATLLLDEEQYISLVWSLNKMASTSPADADKAGEAKRRIAGVSISTESLHRAGLGSVVSRSERRFDVNKLPADMLRVYNALEEKYGEEYALLFVFTMRTAIEMHRAWHMTRK